MTLTKDQPIVYRPHGKGKPVNAVVVSDRPQACGVGMHTERSWDVRREKPTSRGHSCIVTIPEWWIVGAK